QIGTIGLDQLAHKVAHARDELRLAATAIGKEGIVGNIDVARIGPRLGDLAKNGEAAKPGVKDEDAASHGGCWYEKNSRRAMAGRGVAPRASRRCDVGVLRQARRSPRAAALSQRVKRSFTLAKNRRGLTQLMRAKIETSKAAAGLHSGTRRGCSKPKTSV